MNITFLVGNGFDINLGLKTQYSDFYPKYMAKAHDDMISRAIEANYEKWADLESALGIILKDVQPDQIDEFLDCKAVLEEDLADHLRSEALRIESPSSKMPQEFQESISTFYRELSTKERLDYTNWTHTVGEKINYRFISFNYTETLDMIVRKAKRIPAFSTHTYRSVQYVDLLGDVLHIHGTLEADLILGLNDASQIENAQLRTDSRLTDYILKAAVNEALGEQRIENARQIIDNSDYVGIYGLSLGKTDLMWWEYLLDWLLQKSSRRLILYAYTDKVSNPSGPEKLRQSNSWKKAFLDVANAAPDVASKVRDQIIVVFRSTIFDFHDIPIASAAPAGV